MKLKNDPSYSDLLWFFARAQCAVLPLICMTFFLVFPLPTRLIASVTQANESVLLKIKVVNATSQEPIIGAKVLARFLGEIEGPDRLELSTSADGCCDISIPQPQPPYVHVYVEADGYVPVRARWLNIDNPPQHEVIPQFQEFPLEKGISIGGIVKNKEGEPIAGAKVNLSLRGPEGRIRYYVEHAVRSEADGKWRYDAMHRELDELTMEITHPEYVSFDQWVSSAPYLKDKLRDFSAVMVMDRGITVSGFVYDHQGKPIEKALLMTGRSGFFSRVARTDYQGRFEFKHCKLEPLYISAQASGKSPVLRRVLEQDLPKPLKFTLEPGHLIRLRVVDAHGTPLEGVHVIPERYKGYRYILKPNPANLQRGIETDKQGRVSWDSAPPNAVEYAFSKEGFARLSDVAIVADGTEHVVTLMKPVTVSGTVVDKDTGQPIKRFRVVPVLDWLSGGTPFIRRDDAFEANDGEFEWKVSRTDTGHYVRVEADGYVPVMSEMFRVADAESRTYRFELEAGTNITGVVIGADSKPIEGAKVCLCTPMEHLYLSNGELSRPEDTYVVKTATDGAFSFPPERTSVLIAVLHDQGYAQVTPEQLSVSQRVPLQPWGQVKGRLVHDGKPVKNYQVLLSPIRIYNPDSPHLSAQYYTQTDDEGRFVFDRVIPGPVVIKPDLTPWEPSELTSSQHIPLIIQPGRTYNVSLNETGRTVVGKAVLPAGRTRKMTWSYGINYFVALKEGIPVPKDLRHFDDTWHRGWSDTWSASGEGQTYMDTLYTYFVKLNNDGTFYVEGVPPGKYQLVLRVYDAPEGTGCLVNPVATALVNVDVPKASQQDNILDIGNVVVDLCAILQDADLAPPFKVKTLDGKTVRLQDYRGKVVLLTFWATWCGPCVAELPTLKTIHADLAEDDRFEMISMSLDGSIDPVRRLVHQHQLDWVQVHLGNWSETELPSQYSVSYLPAVFIIGPDGKIISQKVDESQIREEVDKALKNIK
jgi:peroxiredoxin/protocatechuate 3,4-dioxygenase beta subunit